jgi:redox-sensitive bicupin YhaK (pirin superfamily)
MGMRRLAASVLDGVGGRVVPTSFGAELSPFLLLAHHTHSFTPFDPTRQIVNLVQPEGFPAHLTRGFILSQSRLREVVGSGTEIRLANPVGMPTGDTQFMRAGSGILHEEMWDIDDSRHTGIEIYQLWGK